MVFLYLCFEMSVTSIVMRQCNCRNLDTVTACTSAQKYLRVQCTKISLTCYSSNLNTVCAGVFTYRTVYTPYAAA